MDMVEKVARALDPRAWKPENMVPTKAITSAMHTRRQSSCISARTAIAAHESALKEMGLVIVPREPTAEMMITGARSIGKSMNIENHTERAKQCHQAMIDAAPKESEKET